MSALLPRLKTVAEAVPAPIGSLLAWVPFSWRLGPKYGASKLDVAKFRRLDGRTRRRFIFRRIRRIADYAYANVEFYRDFWGRHSFHPAQLERFENIARIPIVTKAELKEYEIEQRSASRPGRMLLNTGGTSGELLDFYVDRYAFAREWAHMHHLWRRIGYRQTALKVTFRGRNLGDRPLVYNPVHNEFMANAYCSPHAVADSLRGLTARCQVRFLHGYPSRISEFAKYCDESAPDVARALSRTLQGVLLGSEFPAPVFRNAIERTFGVPTFAWYGHSEMVVLAGEVSKYMYKPLHSYGYCEAVPDGMGEYRLIGTSYFNTASPFIRYDTGDRVTCEDSRGGVLHRFAVSSGRIGDYVIDKRGDRISLTALVYGRHHEVFGKARFIQVRQEIPGRVTILVIAPSDHRLTEDEVRAAFDTSNVALDFEFEIAEKPTRTASGKVPLLIRKLG